MRLLLVGDGESPHLLKWARALAPEVELWCASSRGFAPGFDAVLPVDRRLALQTAPKFEGGNVSLLRCLPRLARWMRQVRPDWIHAHYLTSHGTLAWLAIRCFGVRARLVGSAWGSDILVAPQRSSLVRWLTRQVLRACHITTSDSIAMADRMRELGAEEPMIVPFGLESLPPLPPPGCKDNRLFFANRGLEPIYAPHRVIDTFAAVASQWSDARLVVANDGSLRAAMESLVRERGLAHRVSFTGRLDAVTQAQWYEQARWYLSMPVSDALSVSVLEAMAYGCVPLLSDLPANRELVESGRNGLILPDVPGDIATRLERILPQADEIAQRNHAWVQDNGMFAPAVQRLLERMRAVGRGAPRGFKRFA